MELSKSLEKIKEVFSRGENMIQYMKNITSSSVNSVESILISYDFQAGNYIKKSERFAAFEIDCAKKAVGCFNKYDDFNSILEVGVGEATTLHRILNELNRTVSTSGFDISWSRIRYAQKYLREGRHGVKLFTGDLFNIPLLDNSIDLVYTWHSLEPNGGREREALKELYRIASKYLFIFEPSFEFGSKETKEYIKSHGYVRNLRNIAEELGYHVEEHQLLIENNPLSPNNTAVLLITKTGFDTKKRSDFPFACPVTKQPLELVRDNYYCNNSMLLYPVIDEIPCLLPNNAIIATHYLDKFN